jgi:peptidoglycan biosynthesis protein MviN/MurJ (putative lipid II flippase)
MAIVARAVFPLIAWSFPPTKLELCLRIFWALLPMVLLTGIATNCTTVLNTAGRFTLSALAPALVPISVMAGALFLHRQYDIWALVVFTTLGAALHAGTMAWNMGRHGYPISFRWQGQTDAAAEVASQYGPVLLSSVVAGRGSALAGHLALDRQHLCFFWLCARRLLAAAKASPAIAGGSVEGTPNR